MEQRVGARLKHVEIVFHDPWSFTDTSWKDLDAVKTLTPAECHLSGYLVSEDATQLIIASMIHGEAGEVSMISVVPRGCVVRLNELP